jgi:hypothetical protein
LFRPRRRVASKSGQICPVRLSTKPEAIVSTRPPPRLSLCETGVAESR